MFTGGRSKLFLRFAHKKSPPSFPPSLLIFSPDCTIREAYQDYIKPVLRALEITRFIADPGYRLVSPRSSDLEKEAGRSKFHFRPLRACPSVRLRPAGFPWLVLTCGVHYSGKLVHQVVSGLLGASILFVSPSSSYVLGSCCSPFSLQLFNCRTFRLDFSLVLQPGLLQPWLQTSILCQLLRSHRER